MSHPDDSVANPAGIDFGFPEFWPKVYKQFQQQFEVIGNLMHLGNEVVHVAEDSSAGPVENVICDLTCATISGAVEAIVLCGNGCGLGAMKIVRGMYESRWTAEYLRRHPEEVEDYREFSKILLWRRFHWLQENTPGDASCIPKEVENDYEQTKGRFADRNGRVRMQWSAKSVREIAKDIGFEKEYDLPYSMACSIHHGSFEGLSASFTLEDGSIQPDPPPSIEWIRQALTAVHSNVWFALSTLNDSSNLGFNQKLDAAQQDLLRVWKR